MFNERLIEEVRSRKCLWDRTASIYADRMERSNAWKEISEIMQQPGAMCKKRWKSLRDRFVSEYHIALKTTNGGVAAGKERWRLYESLLFLKNQIQLKKSFSTIEYIDIQSSRDDGTQLPRSVRSAAFNFKYDGEDILSSTQEENAPEEEEEYSRLSNDKTSGNQMVEENFQNMLENYIEKRNIRTHTPSLDVIRQYIDNIDEKYKLDFEFEVLNYAYKKYTEYRNKE